MAPNVQSLFHRDIRVQADSAGVQAQSSIPCRATPKDVDRTPCPEGLRSGRAAMADCQQVPLTVIEPQKYIIHLSLLQDLCQPLPNANLLVTHMVAPSEQKLLTANSD